MAKTKNGHPNAEHGDAAPGGAVPVATSLPECWRIFHEIIAHADRVLLWGYPGTGKTRQAMTTGLRDGQHAYYLGLTQDTPAAEIRGMWIPMPGGFDWHDGPSTAAWRGGNRLVLDEIDRASGDVLSLLMAVVDSQAVACLTLPTRETVRPADGFSVIATMNGDPDHLPAALRDRFTVVIEIDAVHPAALASLPPDIAGAAQATALLPPERRLSLRAWIAFAELRERVDQETAAAAVFGRARAKDVCDAVQLARD